MKLCEKLYELRRAAGLSQEELAERLNVSRQAVSKWENGAAQPELSKLVELSRLYGVSVDELLSLEEAEKCDAKAAASVDASTPAPAQETLAAPKKVRRGQRHAAEEGVDAHAEQVRQLRQHHDVRAGQARVP